MSSLPRRLNKIALSILILNPLFAPLVVHAEEPTPVRDYDRFNIQFGGGWVFGANTTATLVGPSGIGTAIDYGQTLDGETSQSLWRIDGSWHWAKKHSLNYGFYDVNRTGTKIINQTIDFGSATFPVGADIDSQLDIKLHRLVYRYGLADTDQIKLDVGGGLYYGRIDMTLTAVGNVGAIARGTTENVHIGAPLPTAGLNLDCRLTDRWSLIFSTDYFYFAYNAWSGSMTDVMTGVTYKLAKNWTLGAAYDRFLVTLDGPVNPVQNLSISNSWNSLYSYVAFHW